MAITTLATLVAAKREVITLTYTAARTANSLAWASYLGLANNLAAVGTLAGTSTTTGVVPTSATAGFPTIESFGSNTGFIADVEIGSSSAQQKFRLVDLLWKGGAYAFNASTTGQTPTSYASRVPGGTDFAGTEIWLEQVTAATGIQNVNVTYINEAGTAGRSTGTVATAAGVIGRMTRLPLQAGDEGVQGITGVVGSVATVGTFNILVVRPLFICTLPEVGPSNKFFGLDKTMMPQIFDTSALYLLMSSQTNSTNVISLELGIVNG